VGFEAPARRHGAAPKVPQLRSKKARIGREGCAVPAEPIGGLIHAHDPSLGMALRKVSGAFPGAAARIENERPGARAQVALQRLEGRLGMGRHGRRGQAKQMPLQAIEEPAVGRLLSGFDGFSRGKQKPIPSFRGVEPSMAKKGNGGKRRPKKAGRR
jgi:hypothetical protein